MNKKDQVIYVAFLLLLYAIFSTAVSGQEPSLNDRLNRLEARIRSLEEKQKSVAAPDASTLAGNGEASEIEELKRQLAIVSSEVEKLRSGEPPVAFSADQANSIGLGTAAASVYRRKQGVSIAGYGEMLYQNFDKETQAGIRSDKRGQLDFLRAVLYAGYRFNDRFIFNSEIEFEHASTGRGGEVGMEFAYLDYMASNKFILRGGLLLVPMGLTNEFHEPTAFLGSRRSETETQIIPSTWRENGAGILGSAGRFSYRAYVLNGMDASRFSAAGLRAGRQSGARAIAADPAFVGRLDFSPTPGVFWGGSIYVGNSGQGQYVEAGREIGVRTVIGEVHAQLQMRGIDLRALYARTSIDDVAALNRLRGLTGSNSIGEMLHGGYIQFGYNLLAPYSESRRLSPYYRFEKVNSHGSVPQGYLQDPAQNRKFHTFGMEFRPILNIAMKGDYQWIKNRAQTGQNQFNFNLGYSF